MKKAFVIALVVTLAVAGLAVAKKGKRVPTTLSLTNIEATIYDGVAKSSRPACERRRTVIVYHDETRNGLDSADYRIGMDITDRQGEYEVEGNQAPIGDQIIARAMRRKLADGTICKVETVTALALTS